MAVGHEGLPPIPTWEQAQIAAQAIYDHLIKSGDSDLQCGTHAAGTLVSFGSQFLPGGGVSSAPEGLGTGKLEDVLKEHFLARKAAPTGDEAKAIPWLMVIQMIAAFLAQLLKTQPA